MEIWQNYGTVQEVFESVLDFVQSCSHTINVLKVTRDKTLIKTGFLDDKAVAEIESERNTWRLIYALYQVCATFVSDQLKLYKILWAQNSNYH